MFFWPAHNPKYSPTVPEGLKWTKKAFCKEVKQSSDFQEIFFVLSFEMISTTLVSILNP